MNLNATILLLVALIAANLPFLIERQPQNRQQNIAWRLLELVVLYFIVGGIGLLLENKMGDIHPQKWEFYAITASLFVVFAYPGFVYRYLWRRRSI